MRVIASMQLFFVLSICGACATYKASKPPEEISCPEIQDASEREECLRHEETERARQRQQQQQQQQQQQWIRPQSSGLRRLPLYALGSYVEAAPTEVTGGQGKFDTEANRILVLSYAQSLGYAALAKIADDIEQRQKVIAERNRRKKLAVALIGAGTSLATGGLGTGAALAKDGTPPQTGLTATTISVAVVGAIAAPVVAFVDSETVRLQGEVDKLIQKAKDVDRALLAIQSTSVMRDHNGLVSWTSFSQAVYDCERLLNSQILWVVVDPHTGVAIARRNSRD